MTKINKTADVVKSLEDAIRQALGVYPPALPLSVRKKPGAHSHGDNVTSPFGPRTLRGRESFHRGTDIGMVEGTPVHVVYDGKVAYSGWENSNDHSVGGGIYVKVTHQNGLATFYMHLSKPSVSNGDTVKAGEVIGYSGATGNATVDGQKHPHLHFEVRQDGQARAATAEEVRFVQSGGSRKDFPNA